MALNSVLYSSFEDISFNNNNKIQLNHFIVFRDLSGRVLDSRSRGRGFKPHQHRYVVSLSKTHFSLLSTGSTQEDPSPHNWKIFDWDVINQIKQKIPLFNHPGIFVFM